MNKKQQKYEATPVKEQETHEDYLQQTGHNPDHGDEYCGSPEELAL